MISGDSIQKRLHIHRHLAVRFVAFVVGAHALYIIAVTLLDQLAAHRATHLTDLLVDVPILIGLSLLYLGTLLRRRKRTAWTTSIMAYTFYLGTGFAQLINHMSLSEIELREVIRRLLLPLVVLALLFMFEKEFSVKSDIQGFRSALRFSALILIVAFLYGLAGYTLLDRSDFHREITLSSAAHYTIDQFNVTVDKPIHPYTKRADLFVNSLTFVSIAAISYAAISLFQPLRVKLSDQHNERERLQKILEKYGAPSEEYFKLWPHDKQYYFDESGEACLAFHVSRGVALCVGDPVGNPRRYKDLLCGFQELCFSNDWLPALVHVGQQQKPLYEAQDFSLQKLGQEAVLKLEHFQKNVVGTKYFRQINNKFTKQAYSCELLSPPHHQAIVNRLSDISQDWLKRGGRAERGLVMGYFTTEYIQQCQIMVARDAANTIQGFVSLVPANFDTKEATYDLLRHGDGSLGNINDFLLMNLISELIAKKYQRLNLGLCPLSGLNQTDNEQRTFIDTILQFAYANGDRIYSFSGLHKFKAKYQPEWENKYVGYQGGVRGLSRTTAELTRTMRKVAKQPRVSGR